MKSRFRSRVSVLIIIFVVCVMAFTSAAALREGEMSGLYIAAGALLFAIVLLFGMSYEITETRLSVRILGARYYNIPIKDIVSIKRSYNPLSSPAGSLKRLSVKVKERNLFPYVLISPVREKEFLELIKKQNPEVQIDVPDHQEAWRIWDWDV